MAIDICASCKAPLPGAGVPCPVCGAVRAPGSVPSLHSLAPGTTLHQGKYSVGRILGEGGFGITYRGSHRALRQSVAIKEFFPAGAARRRAAVSVSAPQQAAFQHERERILQEARHTFGLRAPSIVTVYDAFFENNTAYIVMEYLDGQTLGARLERDGRLPLDEIRRMTQALCAALTEIHNRHLLHRDVKPNNIMLTPEGQTVLIDFGSARAFQRDRTQKHTRVLTAQYAPPEQYSAQARFGPYTDIFSLGATLYHALTGQPPPSAIDRLQNAAQTVDFPSPLPDPIYAAVRQALELRMDARPQTIADFLHLALPQAPASAQRKAAARRRRPSRRNAWLAPLRRWLRFIPACARRFGSGLNATLLAPAHRWFRSIPPRLLWLGAALASVTLLARSSAMDMNSFAHAPATQSAAALPTPTAAGTLAPAACPHAGVRITLPLEGQNVASDVVVRGTATMDKFWYYKLEHSPARPGDQASWRAFIHPAGGSLSMAAVEDSALGLVNTTLLANGTYVFRLTVVTQDAAAKLCEVTVTVQN